MESKKKREESSWCGDPFYRPPHTSQSAPPWESTCLANVEASVNCRRNRTDFSSKFLFHSAQTLLIVVCDQIHGQTKMPKTS